eukprot:CAMPEP_0113492990 /NCGR_PEP_ID=MMETSP0014_2-20120614/28360_1 /TAXON_ID=2857 /ORGANISM="Nitzschia sp." /LENGTH=120 /DNA_ID=CAMNT_0000386837 /DNA_START=279 /DNA_END=641 /DNA_ORIENTATION=+ /assembly_acc=CAM_ASM_000159
MAVDGFMVTSPTTTTTSSTKATTNTQLEMGFFDFFNDDARKEREEKKRKIVEEQERLQKAIMERRRNPDLMEEYEQKVSIRREMKMKGDFEAAQQIDQYEGAEDLTLLDGSKGASSTSSE